MNIKVAAFTVRAKSINTYCFNRVVKYFVNIIQRLVDKRKDCYWDRGYSFSGIGRGGCTHNSHDELIKQGSHWGIY